MFTNCFFDKKCYNLLYIDNFPINTFISSGFPIAKLTSLADIPLSHKRDGVKIVF